MDKKNFAIDLDNLKADEEPFGIADDADKEAGHQGEGKLISIVIVDLNNREIKLKVSKKI